MHVVDEPKKMYRVGITRTTYAMLFFEVEAQSERDAISQAEQRAYDTEWPSGQAEYEVESVDDEGIWARRRNTGVPGPCATCGATVKTLMGGPDSGYRCGQCRKVFCDKCVDTEGESDCTSHKTPG